MKEKNPKLLKLFCLIVMLNLLFTSCEKDLYEQPTDTSFSPDDAKEWYYSNLKKSEKFKVSSKNNGDKLPDWKNGAYRKIGNFEMIEFPLMKNKNVFLLAKNNSLSDAEKRRILDASLTRVVFIKKGNNKIELRELNYIPDYKYLASKGFDISGVDLSKEKNDFTGTLIIKTWDSRLLSKRILSKGKVIATIKFGKNTNISKNTKSNRNVATSKTNECVIYEDQYWEAQCVIAQQGDVWVYTGECTDWVLVWVSAPYEVCDPVDLCADSSDPDCQCNFYGIGCNDGDGGGGSTTVASIIIDDPVISIGDMSDYLKCFNLNQNARIVFYVDQPTANSSEAWSINGGGSSSGGIINAGHSYIAIQQGENRMVLGFYPETSVSNTQPSANGTFGNDENTEFDVSISVPITSAQLLGIIGYCETGFSYDLNTFNCTDFVIQISNLAGLNLPESESTWSEGGGSNPGLLGQNIREMQLPTDAIRQTTTANSAPNKKTCP